MAQVQLDELLKNETFRNTAIGLGMAVLVPLAVSALAPLARPLARSTVKAGLIALEKGRETAAELGEVFEDLVAEVREELRAERAAAEHGVEAHGVEAAAASAQTVATESEGHSQRPESA